MEMTGLANWSCPVCGASLEAEAHTFRCQNGHSYDRAKKGYVNLLQSNQSHNKRHGDDRAMVAARTAFLDAGYYAPLCKSISEASVACCGDQPTVLDVGCGEGYYTAAVYDALIAAGKTPDVRGVDISREALIAAHRRLGALSLAVASLAHLPMAELSCDLLLNVFAPLDAADPAFMVERVQGLADRGPRDLVLPRNLRLAGERAVYGILVSKYLRFQRLKERAMLDLIRLLGHVPHIIPRNRRAAATCNYNFPHCAAIAFAMPTPVATAVPVMR